MDKTESETMHVKLMQKGVIIHQPESVYIADDVITDRIQKDTVIHAGSRITGKETLICSGAVIGLEAPATIDNALIGPDVSLKGGFFKRGVFLKGASVGSGGHVREGTIFEEYASAAHTVGLKQTILFPFVTLGSLINFCDCLMAGGTGPKNHSEVGSSYIHFNFTPQQDKVTPSLLGDVPAGVMLNRKPIFLGGQGGLVGPARLAFGTVMAAGTICRSDESREGRLIFGGPTKRGNIPFSQNSYRAIKSTVVKNLYYIANLVALSCWYNHVRARFVSEALPTELLHGLKINIRAAIDERVSRLVKFAEKMEIDIAAEEKTAGENESITLIQKRQLFENRKQLEDQVLFSTENPPDDRALRTTFLAAIDKGVDLHGKNDYLNTIQLLEHEELEMGTAWLRGVVDGAVERWMGVLPAFR